MGTLKRRRVLVLMHEDLVPPDSIEGMSDEEVGKAAWKTEFDVVATLREMRQEVRPLGVVSDLGRQRGSRRRLIVEPGQGEPVGRRFDHETSQDGDARPCGQAARGPADGIGKRIPINSELHGREPPRVRREMEQKRVLHPAMPCGRGTGRGWSSWG